jgi:hypothetical protein
VLALSPVFNLSVCVFIFLFFWLDPKETKGQGLIKIRCVSMPEVFSRNTRHEKWHISKHLSLLCIASHMPFAHTSDKNRNRIFLMPVSPKIAFSFGNLAEQRFDS